MRLYKEQGMYGGIDWERVAKHMDYTRSKQNCRNKYRRYRANQEVEKKRKNFWTQDEVWLIVIINL